MEELPAVERAVLVLRYLDELPVREVADVLSLREKTADSRIRRGLVRMRTVIRRRGLAWDGRSLAGLLLAMPVEVFGGQDVLDKSGASAAAPIVQGTFLAGKHLSLLALVSVVIAGACWFGLGDVAAEEAASPLDQVVPITLVRCTLDESLQELHARKVWGDLRLRVFARQREAAWVGPWASVRAPAGMPLRKVLDDLCADLGLSWRERDGVVEFHEPLPADAAILRETMHKESVPWPLRQDAAERLARAGDGQAVHWLLDHSLFTSRRASTACEALEQLHRSVDEATWHRYGPLNSVFSAIALTPSQERRLERVLAESENPNPVLLAYQRLAIRMGLPSGIQQAVEAYEAKGGDWLDIRKCPPDAPALRQLVRDRWDGWDREGARHIQALIAGHLGMTEHSDAIAGWLRRHPDNDRLLRAGMQALVALDPQQADAIAWEWIRSPELAISQRVLAWQCLAQSNQATCLERMLGRLTTADRGLILDQLTILRDPKAVEPFKAGLVDDSVASLILLGGRGFHEVACEDALLDQYLTRKIDWGSADPMWRVIREHRGDKLLNAAVTLSQSKKVEEQQRALALLPHLRHPAAIGAQSFLLQEGATEALRLSAAQTLSRRDAQAAPIMRRLALEKTTPVDIRLTLLFSSPGKLDQEWVDVFLALAGDEEVRIRSQIMRNLSLIIQGGGEDRLERITDVLEDGLQDRDLFVRQGARQSPRHLIRIELIPSDHRLVPLLEQDEPL